MTHYSLLFPGQGSQYVGMGKSFFENAPGALLLSEAEDLLSLPLKRIMLEGPAAELTNTAIAQPAILLHSYAAFLYLKQNQNIQALSMLGHSLGEYSALVASGALSFADAIKVVHQRGKLMQEAVPAGQGVMAAVLGLEVEKIEEILLEFQDPHSETYVAPSTYNGPAQTVIAGTRLGVERARERLKLAGAKRIIELDVSAPFHCALMKPVQNKLAEILSNINFCDARIPIISNVSAQVETKAFRIKDLLLEQIVRPVRFTQCVNAVINHNLLGRGFIELGPKNTLSGIVKKIDCGISVANIDSLEDKISE